MLRILRGERLDALLDAMLAEFERRPLPGLAREIVVVQGRGLDRWISQQAALRRGAWGLTETLYPRPFLLRAFAAVVDGGAPPRRLDDGWMRLELELAIAAELPALSADPRLAPVRAAMAATTARSTADDAALECAPAIAEALDRAGQHRVEMVSRWMRGGTEPEDADEAWLAEIWRRVSKASPPSRLLIDREAFLERCRGERGVPVGLPPRASVFGVSTLAPAFMELLAALAKRMEITVYALHPAPAEAHPLAVAWGIESMEFAAIGARMAGAGEAAVERLPSMATGAEPGPGRLRALQSTLAGGATTDRGGGGAPAAPGGAPDDSLQLLPCRGALDEVERVHASIAALLERDRSLQPRDIAILTPDLETYGPMVEAVFGARCDPHGRPMIPFTVADRDRGGSDAVEALAGLVETALGRCDAREVLDQLSIAAIGSSFGVGSPELERLREWCEAAEVRWGLDEAHRALHGRPGETIGTWQWGLDRLRLGAAMAEGAAGALGTVEPVAPAPALDEGDRPLVDALADFLDAIGALARRLGDRLPLAGGAEGEEWLSIVERLAERSIGGARRAGADERERRGASAGLALVRARLGEMRDAALTAGFGASRRVSARTAMAFILERLRAEHPGRALLAAGVTVAALQPMRSIPFRVIAVVGMADGLIPRRVAAPAFDLVARRRREGDRDARLDDRQVMLETVMAASRALILSWPAQDPTSGLELPPSVLVGELLDAMPELAPQAALRDEAPAGADAEAGAPARTDADAGERAGAAETPDAREGAADSKDRSTVPIALADLERFWRSPAAALLAARGVPLDRAAPERDEEDPIDREFEREILGACLGVDGEIGSDGSARSATDLELGGRGWLPRGATGPMVASELRAMANAWRVRADSLLRAIGASDGLRLRSRPVTVELDLDRTIAPLCRAARARVEGSIEWIDGVGPVTLVPRAHDGDPRALLRGWIRLLAVVVEAADHGVAPPRGWLILGRVGAGRGSERTLELDARLVAPPTADHARALLSAFAALSLHGRAAPLPFMPETAGTYAHHCEKRSPEPESALALARESFLDEGGDDRPSGDGSDPAVRLLLGPDRFFDATPAPSFVTLAERLARPMIRAVKDGSTEKALLAAPPAAGAAAPRRSRKGGAA